MQEFGDVVERSTNLCIGLRSSAPSIALIVALARRLASQCAEPAVWEALWGLVEDGLVYLETAGQHSGTDNWRWRLAADGLRVVKGGTWEPRDPDGYLAASVMLGVAAERAFLVMAGEYAASAMAGAPAMARELARPRGNCFGLWTEFRTKNPRALGVSRWISGSPHGTVRSSSYTSGA